MADLAGRNLERERLRAVIEALPQAVLIVDRDGLVTEANPAAKRLLVHPSAPHDPAASRTHEATGQSAAAAEAALRALRGEPATATEITLTQPGGAVVHLRASTAPLHTARGDIDGAVLVYEDITDLKEIERLKDEFLATASHDLRNPLATVKGMVQLVQRRVRRGADVDREMVSKSLETVERQVDRLGEMLDTLMDVSRIQMGGLDLSTEPIDLAALLRETVEHRRLVTAAHQLRLSIETAPVYVEAERARLLQVLENLISNAIKYNVDGGEVEVELHLAGATVEVSVRDHGIGVAPDALPHLFDRFYRTDAVRGRQLEGSGLGLYICRGIIEALGGRIRAESDGEGLGTCISFTLPQISLEDAD